jgi:hypothetical protein
MQLTKEQIEFLDEVVSVGGKWTLNSEGKIDVDGSVWFINTNLTKIPVEFGRVSASLYCYDNNLTSLEGCPDEVGGNFSFKSNNLKNYFKNIKEEDFKLWDKLNWGDIINEYPFLVNIVKNYVSKERFIDIIKTVPKTKLYLR